MDIKKLFSTDDKKSVEGIWVKLDDVAEIKIARMNNPEFQREFRRLSQPYQSAIRNKTITDEVSKDILIKTFAKTILVGWRGIYEGDKEVPYSVEKAEEYLQIEAFRDFVTACANDYTLFKEKEEEEDVKN